MMVISRQKIDMIIPMYVTAFSATANDVSSVGSTGDTYCNVISKRQINVMKSVDVCI